MFKFPYEPEGGWPLKSYPVNKNIIKMDKDKQIADLERYIRELKQQLSEVINERDSLKHKQHIINKYSDNNRYYDYSFWHESQNLNNTYYRQPGEENGY